MHGVIKSPDIKAARVSVMGVCHRCKHQHKIELPPDLFGAAAFEWSDKHASCELEKPGSVEFLSAKRVIPKGFDDRIYEQHGEAPWWLEYRHNANVTTTYVADSAITMDLSALASSSTFVAGRESTKYTNSSGYPNARISGTYISGTTPTAPAESRLYVIPPYEDTPSWPDVFDGTDSAETVTNTNILATLPLLWSGTVSTSSNVTYPILSMPIGDLLGLMPKDLVLFFAHAHTAALKTDAGNTNSLNIQPFYTTIA